MTASNSHGENRAFRRNPPRAGHRHVQKARIIQHDRRPEGQHMAVQALTRTSPSQLNHPPSARLTSTTAVIRLRLR